MDYPPPSHPVHVPPFCVTANIYLSSLAVSINLRSCSFLPAGLLRLQRPRSFSLPCTRHNQLGFAPLPPSPNSSTQTNPVQSSQLWVTLYWTGLTLPHAEAENDACILKKKYIFFTSPTSWSFVSADNYFESGQTLTSGITCRCHNQCIALAHFLFQFPANFLISVPPVLFSVFRTVRWITHN